MSLSLDTPVTFLDPYNADPETEWRRLRELGHLVPIELDGAVRTWATADHATAERVFTSPAFSKDPKHWAAFQQGHIPEGWPLLPLITMKSMLNREGEDHTRLRALLAKAFTPRRIELLRPMIEDMAGQLLDSLETADGVVDLRRQYAFALPMGVISHLFGVDADTDRDLLAAHYGAVISSQSTPLQVQHAQAGLGQVIGKLIETKRTHPGDDLTSALIAARDGEDRLNDEELVETLLLMLFAGHETSKNLITNAVRSLLEHPDQIAAARSAATAGWSHAAVEETLRWRSPIRVVMFYYATQDVWMDGVLVQQGEPVLIYVAATGRDTARFGPDAEEFKPDRTDAARHLSFARGVHYCIGAPLGRMTASIALQALFSRFTVACEDLSDLTEEWTYASNSVQALPVTLTVMAPV
ncbi:cytochrome P450 [Streptomyces sp. NPDC007901]|uniref:cytochrome P450 family protein n=1 Tax=Streptomyces sp. NPDC007901 TaxID=3364785 RepID=UPI0036EA6401